MICEGVGYECIEVGNKVMEYLNQNMNCPKKPLRDNFEEVLSKQAWMISNSLMKAKCNILYSGVQSTYFFIKDNKLLLGNLGTIRCYIIYKKVLFF